MKDYNELFSYSNFTNIHKDHIHFMVSEQYDCIIASVWMHLGKFQPIQTVSMLSVREADDIKAWCETRCYAWFFDDEMDFCQAEIGMCDLFMATSDPSVGGDFVSLKKARQVRLNELNNN